VFSVAYINGQYGLLLEGLAGFFWHIKFLPASTMPPLRAFCEKQVLLEVSYNLPAPSD
jgi:hypothetical protein